MTTRKQGFTLIELLVVIAIIAILAAILFPVFARAREKARQSTCTSNQRQISASLAMYAQDHDETFPSTGTVWTDLGMDKGVLICPTAGKSLNVGYLYNNYLAGNSIGTFTSPDATMSTIDGLTSSPGGLSYIFYRPCDISWRHSDKFIASYLDGHVAVGDMPKVEWFGGFGKIGELTGVTFGNSGTSPTTISYDPTKPALNQPALNLSSVTTYTGSVPLKNVGINGIVVCQGALANSTTVKSPFVKPPLMTGSWANSYTLCGGGNDGGPVDPALMNVSTSTSSEHWWRNNDNTAPATFMMNFTDFNPHIITVIVPKQQGGNASAYKISIASNTGAGTREISVPICDYYNGMSTAKIFQIAVPFPFKITFTNTGVAPRGYPIRAGGIQAIFLD